MSAAGSAGAPDSSTGSQPPSESGGICPFGEELEYDPAAAYPFCHGNESFGFGPPDPASTVDPIQERCRGASPGSITGAGRHSWTSTDDSPDGEPVTYCLCVAACEVDADCAAGDSGDAAPRCVEGACHLSCDDGETCPDGMTCTQDHESEQRVCMWGSRGPGCDTSEWPTVTQPE